MISAAPQTTLSRRLISYYLMFGLAGLLACLVGVIVLAMQGDVLRLLSGAVILPVVLLLVGGWVLNRTIGVYVGIERQLRQFHSASGSPATQLSPLPLGTLAGQGWNRLVEHVREQSANTRLEASLSATIGSLQEKNWQVIVDILPDGLAVSDQTGKIIRANRSVCGFLGVATAAESLGQTVLQNLRTRFAAHGSEQLAALEQGSSMVCSDLPLGADIAEGTWRVSRIPMRGEAQSAGETLWTFRDVSQQKIVEEGRDQFVAMATHELRTPLANIRAYAETLANQDEIDPKEQQSFYNIISSEATRLARFVDDLLNIRQLETGSISIVRSEVDIGRLVGEIVEHSTPQAKQKSITLTTHCPPKFPRLRADKDKLSAALVNLLGNAIKYTPDGGWVKFTLETDESYLHFIVEDNGIGIAQDELPRMCQKFFRSADARVRAITGSGLGLAFTQEVARLHDGALVMTSELNKGSRFTFSLPVN
jgi:two-component system phosphate regulon sensor histidine kinase PhoR